MAKPDEAEYLLSRNPSMAMKRGSPYTQPKKSKRRRRSKRKYNHNRTNHRTNPHQKLKPLSHHSKSAPLLHQSSSPNAKQGIARLKSLHGGGNGKITITHGELDSNQTYGGGGAEFRVVQCILKREHQLRELQRKVSSSNTRPYFATDIIYMLLDLRTMAVDCIESIAEWRRPHSKTFDFCWEGQNYFKKMYQDSSFLKVCRPLGVCLGLPGIANNPLMEFDTASVNKAMSEYGLHKTWANALRINPTGSIDYDPVALEQVRFVSRRIDGSTDCTNKTCHSFFLHVLPLSGKKIQKKQFIVRQIENSSHVYPCQTHCGRRIKTSATHPRCGQQ